MTPEELKKALHGICAIAVTPMDQNLNVDYDKMARHIRWLIEKGINKSNNCTLVVGGSTGECGGMTIEERKRLIRVAVEAAGEDLPIIAGCNHSCTKDVMDLLEDAEAAKAAGAMVLSPYYYVPTDGTVARFYKEISKASGLGILLYNNLEVTHKDVPEYVIEELVNESNVVGIKECTPNFVKMERMVRRVGNMISVINGPRRISGAVCRSGRNGWLYFQHFQLCSRHRRGNVEGAQRRRLCGGEKDPRPADALFGPGGFRKRHRRRTDRPGHLEARGHAGG